MIFRDRVAIEFEKLSGIPMSRLSSVRDSGRRAWEILVNNPEYIGEIAKETMSGPGGAVAKGMIYGAAGMGSLKGLSKKDKHTGKRVPLEGALKGALAGGATGSLAALILRYPALRRALLRRTQ